MDSILLRLLIHLVTSTVRVGLRLHFFNTPHEANNINRGNLILGHPHLSKWPSDLNQNGIREKVSFSGSVFMALYEAQPFLLLRNTKIVASGWL